MKATSALLLIVILALLFIPNAFAALDREQALEKARAFLRSMQVSVDNTTLDMDSSPKRKITLGRHSVWAFIWSQAFVNVSAESGEILWFGHTHLKNTSWDRFARGEMPAAMLSEKEAVRQARDFASKMGLPVGETKIGHPAPHIIPLENAPSGETGVGTWAITFRRYYREYPMTDYFSVWIDPYEERIVDFMVNWEGMPTCDTEININEEEATRLAIEGFATRGIQAVRDANSERNPPTAIKLMIRHPNYHWTDYPGMVPYSRLVWMTAVAHTDGSALGVVYVDAATGEWLGGDAVRGDSRRLKSIPFSANAKAFLISRWVRSESASIPASNTRSVTLQPKEKARWAALGALLATLTPLDKAPEATGSDCLTFKTKGQVYRLRWGNRGLRLDGPDVPGGAIGYAAEKTFRNKLIGLAAPLAGDIMKQTSSQGKN
ncbi:MAG: hypothetical protein IT210_02235 [Armatimonadetes bacterium]|nr:hypothetical protein [Armatimonadota bacterium]